MWKGKQVAEIFDITPRLLIDLTEKGIVNAEMDKGGRGSTRLYSVDNLFDVELYQELNRFKIPYRYIKHLIETVRNHPNKNNGILLFRIRPDTMTMFSDIRDREDLFRNPDFIVTDNDEYLKEFGATVLSVDLKYLKNKVDTLLKLSSKKYK